MKTWHELPANHNYFHLKMLGGFLIICWFVFILIQTYRGARNKTYWQYSNGSKPPEISENDIVFTDREKIFSDEEVHLILMKRYRYYNDLVPDQQQIFLYRIQHFMKTKVFIIKDDTGYKEMPVLVSAAAIQLCFGLKKYLLPFYRYIRIYSKEYASDHSLAILAGNVQGYTINIAWTQFLKGYEDLADGSNVGLHEMSHALYFQNMVIEEGYAKEFSLKYQQLMNECGAAYKAELQGSKDLYSDYATTDTQEFWAETVELFFEKPTTLQTMYPAVFESMKLVLNQDPFNKQMPAPEHKIILLKEWKEHSAGHIAKPDIIKAD